MEEAIESYLNIFYYNLYDNLQKKNRLKDRSIIKSYLELKSNIRFNLLKESAIPSYKIPNDILKELLIKNYIRESDDVDKFVITIIGIWETEVKNGSINQEDLLIYIGKKFFTTDISSKPLSEKEKIVIMSMIAARTFSDLCPVDMWSDETIRLHWKKILDKTADFLNKLHVNKDTNKENMYVKDETEDPVMIFFRQTDSLSKKTKGIYQAGGKKKYYLNIIKDSQMSKESLSYIIWQIYRDSLSIHLVDQISTFCRDIAFNEGIYLFEYDVYKKYLDSEFDELIRECTKKAISDSSIWDKDI